MAYIVKAVFGSESIVKTDTIYQYNSGQVLQIEGLAFTNSTEFHLAIPGKDTAYVLTGTIANNTAKITIPEILMINDFCTCNYRIDVFVYVIDNSSGYTKYKIIIPVKSRPRPEGYYVDLPTVPELKSLKQELNTAVDNFNDAYTEIDQLKSETASLKEDLGGLNNIIVSRPNMLDGRCVIKQYEYLNGVTGQIAQNPNGSQYWALETYLPIEQGKTYISNCKIGYFYFYDKEKNFIERVAALDKSSVWKYLTVNDERYSYARVYFDTSEPSEFGSKFFFGELDENAVYSDIPSNTTADLLTKYHFVTDDITGNETDNFSELIGHFEKQNYSWVDGFIQASGEMTSSSAFHRSDFVKVPEKAMLYKLKGYSIRADLCSIAFYSTNDKSEIISYVAFSTDVGEFVGVIPPNA